MCNPDGARELFHCAGRRVSLLGDDRILDRLVLLIDDAKLLTVLGIHELHFDLAELTIFDLIGGTVGDGILIA